MHSSQDAGDIVADRGRCWFPQSGYALDTDGTLVLEVSQGADTHDRSCARQMPLGVVYTSVNAGRSWSPAWFVGDRLSSWRGLRPGPSFCGSAGLPHPSGDGLICPDDPARPPYIDHRGIGVLELNATLWSRPPGAQLPIVTPLPRRIVLTCPPGAGIPVGWFRGGPSPAAGPDGLFRLATCCSKDCDAHEPTATLVVFHSRDGGWTWSGISTVPRWGPLFTAGYYPRDAEIALGVVDNSSLLIVNRVTTDIEGSQHKYVNYTMLWSDNLGRSWKRFGPDRNVSRSMAGQWSVLPRMLQLPSGELLLSGGRPGIFVWVGGRDEGREWRRVNICAEHNAGLTPALRAGWGFEPTLTTLEPWAAPVPNEHDGPCCGPPAPEGTAAVGSNPYLRNLAGRYPPELHGKRRVVPDHRL